MKRLTKEKKKEVCLGEVFEEKMFSQPLRGNILIRVDVE